MLSIKQLLTIAFVVVEQDDIIKLLQSVWISGILGWSGGIVRLCWLLKKASDNQDISNIVRLSWFIYNSVISFVVGAMFFLAIDGKVNLELKIVLTVIAGFSSMAIVDTVQRVSQRWIEDRAERLCGFSKKRGNGKNDADNN